MSTQAFRRTIHPTVRVVDAAKGINQYVASDETLDSYREIIRADGWKFDRFEKNAPFVDSHNYETVEKLLGKVIEFKVEGRQLVETVQWALGVDHPLAELGWKLTSNGFLPAVSVGFMPEQSISRWDKNNVNVAGLWEQQIKDLKVADESKVNRIFLKQQQIELSAVIIGANPSALAKGYKAGVVTDADIEFVAGSKGHAGTDAGATEPKAHAQTQKEFETAGTENAQGADYSALAAWAEARTATAFLTQFEAALKRL